METDPAAPGTSTDLTVRAPASRKALSLAGRLQWGLSPAAVALTAHPHEQRKTKLLSCFFLPYVLPGLRCSEVLKDLGPSTPVYHGSGW